MRIFALFGCLIFLFSGCSTSQPPKQKNSVCFNIKNEPNTLDPRQARTLADITLARMFFEGLTRVGKSERAELALANSVSFSSDMKRYTFTLREAHWSNGDEVTAYDFVYAWKKILDPNFPSDTAFQLYDIKNAKAAKEGKIALDAVGVRALDKKTLEVELEYTVPYFLELVTHPAFFPVNVNVDQKNPQWAEGPSSYVCNGPFLLEEWKHSDCIRAKKNESYWDALAVKLSEIELVMVTADTELKLFEKKQLDWVGSPFGTLPVESVNFLRKETLKAKEMKGTYFIRVNTEAFPLDNVLLRKALALSINRKEIVDHVTQGHQLPATGLVPSSFGLQKEPYFQDGAVQDAKKIFSDALAALHLERQSLPEITLLYPATERSHLIAQALEQQWYRALGIRVKLEAMEPKVYYDRVHKQNYQLAAGDWIADFNDPINFLNVFRYKKGSSNNTHWENAQFAELLYRSGMTLSQTERFDLLTQSERLLMDEMPILPIFHHTMLYVQQPQLQDVVLSHMGTIDFKWAHIGSDERHMIAEGVKK